MEMQPQPGTAPQQPPAQPHQHQKNPPDERFLSLSRQVSDLLSRLRLLEERYANLRREHQTTSENMIENHQNLSKQQRKLSEGIIEMKRSLHELQEQLLNMKGELSDAAKIHDLKVLERYLDYWQPLDFITREEAQRIIEDAAQRPNLYKSLRPQRDGHGDRTAPDSPGQDDAGARDGQQPDNTGPAA